MFANWSSPSGRQKSARSSGEQTERVKVSKNQTNTLRAIRANRLGQFWWNNTSHEQEKGYFHVCLPWAVPSLAHATYFSKRSILGLYQWRQCNSEGKFWYKIPPFPESFLEKMPPQGLQNSPRAGGPRAVLEARGRHFFQEARGKGWNFYIIHQWNQFHSLSLLFTLLSPIVKFLVPRDDGNLLSLCLILKSALLCNSG